MPVSTVTYTANGSTNQFSITFPYIDAAHVLVSVNGSSASFSFHNSTTAQLSSTPTSGQTVVVFRQTPSPNFRLLGNLTVNDPMPKPHPGLAELLESTCYSG